MKMCNLAAKRALERSQTVLVRVVEVLVEDRNPKNGNEVMGRFGRGEAIKGIVGGCEDFDDKFYFVSSGD